MSYPVLSLRIKAMLLDSVLLGVLFFSLVLLTIQFEITNSIFKALFIVLPVILLEPAMMWLTGGSIGHHYSGLRVVGKNSGKNLFIINGIVRFITKTFLGFYSIIMMFLTKRHQSVHDYLSMSVVVFKNEDTVPSRNKLKPREAEDALKKPSIIRRLVVSTAYSFLAFVIYNISIYFVVSDFCIESNQCGEADMFNIGLAVSVLFLTVIVVFILGLICKLPGVYYRKVNQVF